MFFRRHKPATFTFENRLQMLRDLGFKTEPAGGKTWVSRDGCAVVMASEEGSVVMEKPGLLMDGDIGLLTHCGYQMFFRTGEGVMCPAQAGQLKALHRFTEDVAESLGDTSLYNTSLGTVCESHLYDRVEDRDAGVAPQAWERG